MQNCNQPEVNNNAIPNQGDRQHTYIHIYINIYEVIIK